MRRPISFDRSRWDRMEADAEAARASEENVFRNYLYDTMQGSAGPVTANALASLVDFVPVFGDLSAFEDARNAIGRGDYGRAAFDAATGVVGLVPGAGDAMAAGVNTLAPAIFAGVRAANAPLDALRTAERMRDAGATRDEIWRETGWFWGVDGKPRFEIDDSGARVTPLVAEPQNYRPRAEDVMPHDALYSEYPYIGRVPVTIDELVNANGLYFPNDGPGTDAFMLDPRIADPRSTMLHESQHAIQARENFAQGASFLAPHLDARIEEIERLLSQPISFDQYQELIRERASLVSAAPDPADIYRRTSGEVEARNVQARRDFTAEQRRATPPWETQDVPDERQIVRRR